MRVTKGEIQKLNIPRHTWLVKKKDVVSPSTVDFIIQSQRDADETGLGNVWLRMNSSRDRTNVLAVSLKMMTVQNRETFFYYITEDNLIAYVGDKIRGDSFGWDYVRDARNLIIDGVDGENVRYNLNDEIVKLVRHRVHRGYWTVVGSELDDEGILNFYGKSMLDVLRDFFLEATV